MNNLVRNDFDVAVRAGAVTGGTLIARRLAQVEIGLFGSRDFLAARSLQPDALDPETLPMVDLIKGVPHRAAKRGRARLSMNDPLLIMGQVIEGTGLAWLPVHLAAEEVEQGRLLRCCPNKTITGPEIFALCAAKKSYLQRRECSLIFWQTTFA